MKVLAIIPAKADSIGIPNRNIRFINGKPLVYYAIKNAKASKLITDIIVSTDSPEIKIIATRMGAEVKHRPIELTRDEVALDAVVYHAAQDKCVDYVVTVQPTFPTLRIETLDMAIQYAIDNGCDTVVSAVRSSNLMWTEVNGARKPAYEDRFNERRISYIETGAFVISKGSIVRPDSRFGTKIDIYEIPQEEAINVYSYDQLRQAENVMSKKSVALYVNGNNGRGVGHIYRSLELADEFYYKPDIYYDVNQTERGVFGITTHNLIPVNGIGELLSILMEKQYDVFINDILSTSIDYMIAVRTSLPNAKIINFEDDGEGIFKADLVFNALYKDENSPNVKAGEKYYISNKLFMFYEPIQINETVKRVFISFGGADPQNYSDRMLNIIKDNEYKNYGFIVVLGRAKLNVEQLIEYNNYSNITVLHDVNNMPEVMSDCDIAVTSRGRTGYELAILGVPTIAISQNKREERHGFVCNENGFSYIGLNPSDNVIKSTLDMYLKMSKEERQRYQDILLSHDLRNGRKHVMNLINTLLD